MCDHWLPSYSELRFLYLYIHLYIHLYTYIRMDIWTHWCYIHTTNSCPHIYIYIVSYNFSTPRITFWWMELSTHKMTYLCTYVHTTYRLNATYFPLPKRLTTVTVIATFSLYLPGYSAWVLSSFIHLSGDSANAVPHYQKLHARVPHVWGNRRLQPGEVHCTGLHLGCLPSWSQTACAR